MFEDHNLVQEALCAENCLGRWIWKSSNLQGASQVPWEVQSINTCPEDFLWEKNKTAIVMAAPGLYQISLGIFSRRAENAKVYLNGEVIIQTKDRTSRETKCTHSAGNVTGLTLVDFVALPARARISISYDGDKPAEGFLCMRKL